MKLKFTQQEKMDIIRIGISAMSLIAGFTLSINYLSWISVALCGIPIFKECIEGLIKEFDLLEKMRDIIEDEKFEINSINGILISKEIDNLSNPLTDKYSVDKIY